MQKIVMNLGDDGGVGVPLTAPVVYALPDQCFDGRITRTGVHLTGEVIDE